MTPLPCGECKGRCCTYPVFTAQEFQTVRILRGVPNTATVIEIQHDQSYDPAVTKGSKGILIYGDKGICPYLQEGKCSIYAFRPKVCRDYGNVPDLPCEYLYPEQAKAKHEARLKSTDFKPTSPDEIVVKGAGKIL